VREEQLVAGISFSLKVLVVGGGLDELLCYSVELSKYRLALLRDRERELIAEVKGQLE
jgi:hypothetical protein